MDIREFDETEIGEINSYVVNQIQNSVDLNQYFVLSEEPIKKTRVFIAIYRILTGVRDFIEKKETKEKLDDFLKDTKDLYSCLYSDLMAYDNLANYNKKRILRKIILTYQDVDKNLSVNHLINSFLVFAEKQELLETEKVTGLDMDKHEGNEAYKKLQLK